MLGVVDALSETEEAEYMGCETVIVMGWHTFVDVGLAFARIRDSRLYRVEFDDFEAYCRVKWQHDGTTSIGSSLQRRSLGIR